jgi:hypothetical protein
MVSSFNAGDADRLKTSQAKLSTAPSAAHDLTIVISSPTVSEPTPVIARDYVESPKSDRSISVDVGDYRNMAPATVAANLIQNTMEDVTEDKVCQILGKK